MVGKSKYCNVAWREERENIVERSDMDSRKVVCENVIGM
jgi:hypothetical protein